MLGEQTDGTAPGQGLCGRRGGRDRVGGDRPAARACWGHERRAERTRHRLAGAVGCDGLRRDRLGGQDGTKEALFLALDRAVPGGAHRSVKSYNNHTGVPLSLARMPRESSFGVFEMGMNHAVSWPR
jgi:hypothetical protein